MNDKNDRPDVDATEPAPGSHEIKSKYEFVMAAAKEAERLNDCCRKDGINPEEKVTVDAIRRINKGTSRVVYEEPQGAQEEAAKESTYFFGS